MRYLFLCVVIVCFVLNPAPAKATTWSDNFNDTVTDPLWSYNGGIDPNASLYENNGKLNFIANSGSSNANEQYMSSLDFGINSDIWERMDFNNSYGGAGEGGIALGLYPFNYGGPSWLASVGAVYNGTEAPNKRFLMSASAYTGQVHRYWQEFERTIDSGWFNIHYDAAGNKMEFMVYDQNDTQVAYGVFNNFRDTFVDPMRAYINGYTGINGIDSMPEGNVFADNFEITDAPVPEPLTSGLFIFGSALLGLMGRSRSRAHQ